MRTRLIPPQSACPISLVSQPKCIQCKVNVLTAELAYQKQTKVSICVALTAGIFTVTCSATDFHTAIAGPCSPATYIKINIDDYVLYF